MSEEDKKIKFFILVVLLALAWRVLFFSIGVLELNLSGDEAIRSLQAMGIADSKDSYQVQLQQAPPGLFNHYPLLFMAQPYLFPVEAYLSAPFIHLLPPGAFASRLIPAVMGLITFWFCLLLVHGLFTSKNDVDNAYCHGAAHYGALFLTVFPSTFILLLQVGYPLPSYQALMMFGVLALWLSERNRRVSWRNPFMALGGGFFVGLAASNSLLALPLAAGIGVMVGMGNSRRKALTGSAAGLVGIALGLSPYFLAKTIYPGAYGAVSSLVGPDVALSRLLEPAVTFTLPVALGMGVPIIPGWERIIGFIPVDFYPYAGYLWLLFICGALFCCIFRFVAGSMCVRWPEITVWDVMVGLSLGYLLIFVFSTRFGGREFRYLMPVALFFPLILAWLLSWSRGFFRCFLTLFVWVVIVINIVTSILLLKAWRSDDFDGGFADTRPAVKWLKQHDITHCYSSYMDVYTMNYFAKGELVCAQPYNQRFPGWPYPYGEVVDESDNVAFVLGPSRRFPRERLENELRSVGVSHRREVVGDCVIYYDFSRPGVVAGERIDPKSIKVTASHHGEDCYTLSDGIFKHQWRSHMAQTVKMWIELTLPRTTRLGRIKMYYNEYPHDHALALNILVKDDNNDWRIVASDLKWRLEPFDFLHGHPVYGNLVQLIDMHAVYAKTIRIEIARPNLGRDWTIGEIEVRALGTP